MNIWKTDFPCIIYCFFISQTKHIDRKMELAIPLLNPFLFFGSKASVMDSKCVLHFLLPFASDRLTVQIFFNRFIIVQSHFLPRKCRFFDVAEISLVNGSAVCCRHQDHIGGDSGQSYREMIVEISVEVRVFPKIASVSCNKERITG